MTDKANDRPAAVEHGGDGDEWREMWTRPYVPPVEPTALSPLVQVNQISRALAQAISPPQVIEIEAKIAALENYMREAGLYSTEEIRPVNERMRARRRLGQLLAEIERGAGPGRGKKEGGTRPSFRSYICEIGLAATAAKEAQRIAALPESELAKALARARDRDTLTHFTELIALARPYWAKATPEKRHREIDASAEAAAVGMPIGPFPLLYADPAWKFSVYSEAGLEYTPDRHYRTLTDEEIMNFKIGDKTGSEIAHKDAALLMWCTSSNIHRALRVMDAWGFTFKANAVWVKDRTAQGYVFRNRHEHLLYGSAATCPAASTIRAAFTAPSHRRSGLRSRRCIPLSMRTRASNCRPRERNDSRLDLRRARSIHDAGTGRAMTAAELRCAVPVLPAHTVTDNA
jgi:MT-A70